MNYQELDKKIFSDLIHDPSAISADDSEMLAGLVEKYPYAQLLRSFYTRSLVNSPSSTFEKELAKTALFSTDRVVLQTIIEYPESIKSRIRGPRFNDQEIAKTFESAPTDEETVAPETALDGPDFIPEPDTLIREESNTPTPEPDHSAEDVHETLVPEETLPADEAEGEVGSILAAETENSASNLTALNEVPSVEEEPDEKDSDLAGNLKDSLVSGEESSPVKDSTDHDNLDLLIKQNAASDDFLKEHEARDAVLDRTEDVFTPEVDIAENITHNAVIANQQKISKYDDDKMPYSFLWWLSKTRNEHAENYQPYVSFKLDTSQNIKRNTVDQLSTQIIENIFHLQSPVDELKNAPKTVPFQVKRKEDFIVEKFIREEPQIKPPNSEKLDSENKARKSAEDPNDLVSETLAHIYTDQMLFHKAIETYKKLSLKFPEKSTYFADQIRDLEKKLN